MTNKIESQELKDIYESTWSQGECYDKCDDYKKVVAISGDKTKCISINNFKGGKYKDLLPYDPIALISLLASFNEYKKDTDLIELDASDNSYSYIDIIYKYENDTKLYDKNKNDILGWQPNFHFSKKKK